MSSNSDMSNPPKEFTPSDDAWKTILTLGDDAQPDRVVAIVSCAYAEDYLGRALKSKLPGLNSHLRDRLFNDTGALGPVSSKIDMAKALGIIDGPTYKDFVLLARIRNRFAHRIEVDSFDNEKVAELCMEFSKVRLAEQGRGSGSWGIKLAATQLEMNSNRRKFIHAAMIMCMELDSYVSRQSKIG